MKKAIWHLSVVCATLVLLGLLASATPALAVTEPGTMLYQWTASWNGKDETRKQVAFQDNLVASGSATHFYSYPTLYTEEGPVKGYVYGLYNNVNSAGKGLPSEKTPEGKLKFKENLEVELVDPKAFPLDTTGYDAVAISIFYGYIPANNENNLAFERRAEVYVAIEGQDGYLTDCVTLRNTVLLGSGPTTDKPAKEMFYYRLTFENLMEIDGLRSGDKIKSIMIKPQGDSAITFGGFYFRGVTITGYQRENDYEIEFPKNLQENISLSGDLLREVVANEAKQTAEIQWITPTEVTTICPVGTFLEATSALNLNYLPDYSYRGPVYGRQIDSTRELLQSRIVKGVYLGGYDNDTAYGMDCQAFVMNAISRVSRTWAWAVQTSLGDTHLVLMDGLKVRPHPTYTNEDILSVNSAQELYMGYSKLKKGDVVLNYTGNSVHTRVVTGDQAVISYNKDGEIEPDNSYILCTESSARVVYFIENSNGQIEMIETNIPGDLEAYLSKHSGARVLYGQSCRVDRKYTFSQLEKEFYAPYTLKEYQEEAVEKENVQFVMTTKAGGQEFTKNGFYAVASSNYRILQTTVKLEDMSQGSILYEDTVMALDTHVTAASYSSETLDRKLAELSDGQYCLSMTIKSGPVTEIEGSIPETSKSVEFTVTGREPNVTLSLNIDHENFTTGQPAEVIISTDGAIDSVEMEIKYDSTQFSFVDGKMSPVCTYKEIINDADNGIVRIAAINSGIESDGGQLATLYFIAQGTISAPEFHIKRAMISPAEEVSVGDLVKAAVTSKQMLLIES